MKASKASISFSRVRHGCGQEDGLIASFGDLPPEPMERSLKRKVTDRAPEVRTLRIKTTLGPTHGREQHTLVSLPVHKVRIPMKPAMHSNLKPATRSEMKPAMVPI